MVNVSTLFLLPCSLGENVTFTIPSYITTTVNTLDVFFVENERSARRYLRAIGYTKSFDEVQLFLLDKHNKNTFIKAALQDLLTHKKNAGVLSEAGLPCIADPGHEVVKLAHQLKIKVDPLVGPSSIILALIASGMNGQSFTFHGYLPVEAEHQKKKLKEIESLAIKTGYTQLFMETPYRNNKLVDTITQCCSPELLLSVACDITLPTQYICTQSIAEWKKEKIDIHKRPAIFSINRNQ
jgi:16S rRNA (cytidine1402-2'-O)-methyltransferase